MAPTIGDHLWLLDETKEYAQSCHDGWGVDPLPPGLVILRGRYLEEREATEDRLEQERHRLAHDNSSLLLVVPSTDGPPHRSVFVYEWTANHDVPVIRPHLTISPPPMPPVRAKLYRVVTEAGPHGWISQYRLGQRGFFLTGTSPTKDLWRISRMDVDAHRRLLVTLFPVWLPAGIVSPDFRSVTDPILLASFTEAFRAFQGAVAAGAYLSVVSHARAVAECVLWYCLGGAGRPKPDSLNEMLNKARKIMDSPEKPAQFPLDEYGFHLGHRIRLLFQKTHIDKVARSGEVIRPEVAMSSAVDVSELLVSVRLARY